MSKGGKGGNSGGPSKNLSPAEHAARKRDAKARRGARRGGRLSMTPSETLAASLDADRLQSAARQIAVVEIRRYGTNPPFGKNEARWVPETIDLAVTLMESYFTGDETDVKVTQDIVKAVRTAFARVCARRNLKDVPGQDEDWYPEFAVKAQQWLANKPSAKTPVNA